jgi:hypothetical protein
MKKTFVSLLSILLLLLGTGCLPADAAQEETRDLEPFTGIAIGISADVYYTPGNTHEIRIEGNERDVKELIVKVENGTLKLKYDDWRTGRSKLTIHIISRELEKVSVSGSAKFMAEKPVSSEEMTISISGSGTVQFSELKGDEMDVRISGSGNAAIEKGTADEMEVDISGSGKLQAEHFSVSELSVNISGSGTCRITVTDELDARLSGSGSVYYHGNPEVNSKASGSGKVRSL